MCWYQRMPVQAETHVAPGAPDYRDRFARLLELASLASCPVPVSDPEAAARIENACRSLRERAFAVGQPLLKELISHNATEMFDRKATEGVALGFHSDSACAADSSVNDLVECARVQLELHEWFTRVIPVIQAPPEP